MSKNTQMIRAKRSLKRRAGESAQVRARDELRVSFLTREISEAKAQAIANAQMNSRHDHLNALLNDDDFGVS